jgi:hypothetical protein
MCVGKGLGGGIHHRLYWNKGPCNGEPSVGPNLARLAVKGFTERKDLFELLFFPLDTHWVSQIFFENRHFKKRNACILHASYVGCGL